MTVCSFSVISPQQSIRDQQGHPDIATGSLFLGTLDKEPHTPIATVPLPQPPSDHRHHLSEQTNSIHSPHPTMVPDTGVILRQFPHKAVESYGEVEFSRLDRKLAMFRALSPDDRALLPEFESRISAIAQCIDANADLLAHIADSATSIRSTTSAPSTPTTNGHANTLSQAPADERTDDHDADEKQLLSREVRRGFTLLARDWSVVGESKRAECYTPLVEAVESAFADASRANQSLARDAFRVLVPGAGAGRLPWELVRRGFAVEGCESSFTALLVGNYALNSVSGEAASVIYPFAHEHSNVASKETATRGVSVPDVNPKDIPNLADFAMRAGNFVHAYEGQDDEWDAVVSCMAFDLGDAVIEHVRRVSQIVKPGGIWAFVGPRPCLDGGQMEGIHLSVEEFMGIVRKTGFKIVKMDEVEVLHSADPESLRSIQLRCPFVVAVKEQVQVQVEPAA